MSDPRVRVFQRVVQSDLERHEWKSAVMHSIPSMKEGVGLIELDDKGQIKGAITGGERGSAVDRAVEWLHEIGLLLKRKNAAYGDSASNPMRVFSKASTVEQILVRIDDKLSRIARGSGLAGDDEDVLRDLVGYLALLAALQSKEK